MAYQSLYRRFRPKRFSEVKGQTHLVSALQNAVRDDRVGHAYLLSGPRGTGKTTAARLLAKALNCESLGADGEPCTTCNSCLAIEAGSSMDLFELDAASNRGIDDVKDLVRSVAMGSPGRRKVYILDEVHMLTKEASNALLKTLEEPPDHVVFVLATTDPQKVLDTIRSRTQHIELSLVGAETMAGLVREIGKVAELDITDEIVEHVVRQGGGSVRDALSCLDQVVAAGGVAREHLSVETIVNSLIDADPGAALAAVAEAVSAGADPRDLTEQLTRHLRDVFLVQQDAAPGELPAELIELLSSQGKALGAASAVRALETLGGSLVDMRQASDTRLVLEVALVRLTSAEASNGLDSLRRRIEVLEAAVQAKGVSAGPESSSSRTPTAGADDRRSRPAGVEGPPKTSADTSVVSVHADAMEPDSGTAQANAADSPSTGRSSKGSNSKFAAARGALAGASGQSHMPKPEQVVATPSPPPKAPPAPPTTKAPSVPPVSPTPHSPEAPEPRPPAQSESGEDDLGSASLTEAPHGDDTRSESSPSTSSAESPRGGERSEPDQAPSDGPHASPLPAGQAPPTSAAIEGVWPSAIQPNLTAKARVRFQAGHFDDAGDGVAVNYVIPNTHYRDRCLEVSQEVADAISAHFGVKVAIEVVIGGADSDDSRSSTSDTGSPIAGATGDASDEYISAVDTDQLVDATDAGITGAQRLQAAFPGASIVEPDTDG